MKKIYTLLVILVFLAFATQLFGQDTLKPIGWITYPSDVNWSVDKFAKKAVTIKKAPAEWTFDAGTFVLSEIWDKLGDENEIKNNTRSEGWRSIPERRFRRYLESILRQRIPVPWLEIC